MNVPRWTITALTIPGREPFLRRLLESAEHAGLAPRTRFHVIYNKPIRDDLAEVEREFQSWTRRYQVDVFFNNRDPTISGGRNFQLNLVKTPLVCFVDDDITFDGKVFDALEAAMRQRDVGMIGLRSVIADSGEQFKPRPDTPQIDDGEFKWMVVQGMLAASYTNLLRDVGGFNKRREFWGEWTELNLRLWRHGFPTGYLMEGPTLRHWTDAPESPTRNMEGRALHVLWGLICTALEYDAVDISEANESFWNLVERRYLAYSFGEDLSPRTVLQRTLELMPRISGQWSEISAFREMAAEHPFQFKPFHALTRKDLDRILPTARRKLKGYRAGIWPRERNTAVGRVARLVSRMLPRPREGSIRA